MAKKNWYALAAKDVDGEKVAELRIYDEIGFWGVTAKQFMDELDAVAAGATRVLLSINSPGGSVFDAFAIYNGLRRLQLHVVGRVDGMAASAASLILMAADEIIMPENAMLMIHDAWTIAGGTAEELRKTADMMDKAGDGIVAAYTSRSGQPEDKVREMMAETTWLSALEAQALGFCDAIESPVKIVASLRAVGLLEGYKGAPEDWLKALGDPEPDDSPEPPAQQPAPQVNDFARQVITMCQEKGIPQLSNSIILAGGLDSEQAVSARIDTALEISGLCAAAQLPDLAGDYIVAGLDVEKVRARLFDRVVQDSVGKISNLQRPQDSTPAAKPRALNASAIYAARKSTT
ncbi:Clp protease ClpP [Pseudomonas sp. S 311-6]|nr:Clp protease ClpP [Pseudomonas sp. S 311-6]